MRDRLGAGGVGEQRELVEVVLGLDRRSRAFDAGADEQRALPDDPEVDLGRGEPSPLATFVALRHAAQPVEVDVDVEHVHDRTAEPERGAEVDGEVAAGNVHDRPGRRPGPRWCATAADAHAPVPHDSVSPTPRSQTRMVSASASSGRRAR